MLSAALAIVNAVQFSVCSGVLRVLGLAGARPRRHRALRALVFLVLGARIALFGYFGDGLAGSWGLGRFLGRNAAGAQPSSLCAAVWCVSGVCRSPAPSVY